MAGLKTIDDVEGRTQRMLSQVEQGTPIMQAAVYCFGSYPNYFRNVKPDDKIKIALANRSVSLGSCSRRKYDDGIVVKPVKMSAARRAKLQAHCDKLGIPVNRFVNSLIAKALGEV